MQVLLYVQITIAEKESLLLFPKHRSEQMQLYSNLNVHWNLAAACAYIDFANLF